MKKAIIIGASIIAAVGVAAAGWMLYVRKLDKKQVMAISESDFPSLDYQ